MSNELTTTGPSYLANKNIKDQLDHQNRLIENPLQLFPKLKMEKARVGFVAQMGEQVLESYPEVYYSCLGPEAFLGSRALFAPGDDAKMPVCATRLMNPGKNWQGQWMSDDYENPGATYCENCPYAQFGSAGEWKGDESKGTACVERRMIFGTIAEENEGNSFIIQNKTVLALELPVTSLKAADNMLLQATSAQLPLSAAVFNLSNEIQTRGSVKWSVLKTALKGFIANEGDYTFNVEEAAKIARLVSKTMEPHTESYNKTTVPTQEEADNAF